MKNFVFRINENGFYDWLRSIWKMRSIINSYNNTQCDDYKEYIKSSFQEANLLYKEVFGDFQTPLDFCLQVTKLIKDK